MNANIKGHTLIELTNTKTGQVQRYEKDNMLTQAILKLWANPWGLNSYPLSPAQLMSGIMLFANEQEESVTNYKLTEMPGTWAGNCANTTSETTYGSMNLTESEVTSNGVKFVWDWTAEQGNGTYRSASLTSPLLCNDKAYGMWTRNGGTSADATGMYPLDNKCIIHNGYFITQAGYENFQIMTPSSSSAINPLAQPFCYDNVNGYLYGMTSTNGTTLNITRMHCPTDTVSLTRGWNFNYNNQYPAYPCLGTVESKTFNLSSAIYNTLTNSSALRCMAYCAGSSGTIYIITLSGYGTSGGMTMQVTAINYDAEVVIQNSFSLTTGVRLLNGLPYQWCNAYPVKHPYIYVPGSGTSANWYKINVITGAQEELTKTGSSYTLSQVCYGFTAADPLYYLWTATPSNTGTRTGVSINTLTDTVDYTARIPEASSSGTLSSRFTDPEFRLGGKCALIQSDLINIYAFGNEKNTTTSTRGYATAEINPCYKATINNFATPITKTSDSTMKITYTLTQS